MKIDGLKKFSNRTSDQFQPRFFPLLKVKDLEIEIKVEKVQNFPIQIDIYLF